MAKCINLFDELLLKYCHMLFTPITMKTRAAKKNSYIRATVPRASQRMQQCEIQQQWRQSEGQ